MNFVVDMNLPANWVDFLTGAGFTAVHWSAEGPPNASDSEVLEWAAGRGYVVLTAYWDAAGMAAPGGVRPGIVVAGGASLTPEALGGAVLAAVHGAKAALAGGAVVPVDGNRR